MARIELSSGDVVLVDDCDCSAVSQHSWHRMGGTRGQYVGTSISGRTVFMHRLILRPPPGREVDHRNGDPLDNRRANLRLATRSQNNANARKQDNCKSIYKGVHPQGAGWYAYIYQDLRKVHLGVYRTEEDAAHAYDAAAKELFGEFARPNFK